MRSLCAGFVVIAALASAGGAAAKGSPPYAVGICGPAACATVVDVADWRYPDWLLSDRNMRTAPTGPQPFYSLGMLYADSDRTTSPVAYYVPAARVIKLKGSIPGRGEAIWLRVAPNVAEVLDRASAGLRPFARPRVHWAMVGNRWVKKPGRYDRLYSLAGSSAPDPAGEPPALQYQTPGDREAWFAAWGPYLKRVEAEWIPVQIGTRAFSPWDVRESYVWVGRRLDILKRDGYVIEIPAFVADLVRRAAPL